MKNKQLNRSLSIENTQDLFIFTEMWLSICDYGCNFQDMRYLGKARNSKSNDETSLNFSYINDYSRLALGIANIDNLLYKYICNEAPHLKAKWEADNKLVYEALFFPDNSTFKDEYGIVTISSLYLKEKYGDAKVDALVGYKAELFNKFKDLNEGSPMSSFSLEDILEKRGGLISNKRQLRNRFVRIFIERKKLFYVQVKTKLVQLQHAVAPGKLEEKYFNDFSSFASSLMEFSEYRALTVKSEMAPNVNRIEDESKGDYDEDIEETVQASEELDQELEKPGQEVDILKIKKKLDDIYSKLNKVENTSLKYQLTNALKKDSLWNEGKRNEAVVSHMTKLGTTTMGYLGSEISVYLMSGKMDSKDFWEGFAKSIGPLFLSGIGDLIGGPLLGSLFSGIGTSFFGSIFGRKPSPMEKVVARIDHLEENMNNQFDEVKHLLSDGFNEVFKGFNVLQLNMEQIENQLCRIQATLSDIIIKLDESSFKSDLQNLLEAIQQIDNLYNDIFVEAREITDHELQSLFNSDRDILNKIESTIRDYFSSSYQILEKSVIPTKASGTVRSVVDDLLKKGMAFDKAIDHIQEDVLILSGVMRYYFMNRESISAVFSGVLLFAPEILSNSSSISAVESTQKEIFAMQDIKDRVNSSLLFDASRIKKNIVGKHNLRLYSSFMRKKESGNHDQPDFLSNFIFTNREATEKTIYEKEGGVFYSFNLIDGFATTAHPQKVQFIDFPVTDEQKTDYKDQISVATRLLSIGEDADKTPLSAFCLQISLENDDALRITLPGEVLQKEVRAFYLDSYLYNEKNEKKLIFDATNDSNKYSNRRGNSFLETEARILSGVPFCSVAEMLPKYLAPEDLMKKMYPFSQGRGLAWEKTRSSIELCIYKWAIDPHDYDKRNFVTKVCGTGLKCEIDNRYNDLMDQYLYIRVDDKKRKKIVLEISDADGKMYTNNSSSIDNQTFLPYDFQKQVNRPLRLGEMLLDKRNSGQLIFEHTGTLAIYEVISPKIKKLRYKLFEPSEKMGRLSMKIGKTEILGEKSYFRLEVHSGDKMLAFSSSFLTKGTMKLFSMYFSDFSVTIRDESVYGGVGEIKKLYKQDSSRLYSGETLFPEEKKISKSGEYHMYIQENDGNVVVRKISTGKCVWDTHFYNDSYKGSKIVFLNDHSTLKVVTPNGGVVAMAKLSEWIEYLEIRDTGKPYLMPGNIPLLMSKM